MKYTSNLKLKKPDGTDVVNVDDLNDNADIVDLEIKKSQDNINSVLTKANKNAKDIVSANAKIGDISKFERITYVELKSRKDNNQLIEGKRYLLIDYQTKYQQPTSNIIKTMAVEQLVLTASSENTFQPIVYSPSYSSDVIYYNFDDNTCEDDSTARNGFITYRIDTVNGLYCPQDWRTMLWYRSDGEYKTFGDKCHDIYIGTIKTLHNNVFANYCDYNSFGNRCHSNTFGNGFEHNSFENSCYYNSFGDGCRYNSFGNSCYYNSFGESCHDNKLDDKCHSNSFGNRCYSNTFGNDCESNSFGNYCYSNTFDDNCDFNSFGNSCDSNSFGKSCDSNSFGNSCDYNSFGNGCDYNSFGNGCYNNTFGDDCYSNIFGNNCGRNTFVDNCDNNSCGSSFYSNTFGRFFRSNSFGNNCNSNTFGDSCYYNSFGNHFNSNAFGNDCDYNSFENDCSSNTFGENFYNLFIKKLNNKDVSNILDLKAKARITNIERNSSGDYIYWYFDSSNNIVTHVIP